MLGILGRMGFVVGVDAASAYRLGELFAANGALIFPPHFSFYNILAATWCACAAISMRFTNRFIP